MTSLGLQVILYGAEGAGLVVHIGKISLLK